MKKLQIGSDFPSTRDVARTLKQLGFDLRVDVAGENVIAGLDGVDVSRGRVYGTRRASAPLRTRKYSAYVSKGAGSKASIRSHSKANGKKK